MIIVVAGKAQDVGKSTVVCQLIENLRPEVSVIKSSLKHNLAQTLVTDAPEIVEVAGTDTGRFLASGACKVVYLKTTYDKLATDWQRSRELVGEARYLIVEGNSVLEYLQPDLVIYLDRIGVEAKPSAERAYRQADLIVDSDRLFATLRRSGEADLIPAFRRNPGSFSPQKEELICQVLGLQDRESLQQIELIDP